MFTEGVILAYMKGLEYHGDLWSIIRLLIWTQSCFMH